MSITSLYVGADVAWIPDGEEGVVIRVLDDHQAVCIRWESGKDYWYSAWSGSLHNIELIGHNEEREAA